MKKISLAQFLADHGLTAHAPALATYAALLRQWNPKINLVAPATLPGLENRHIVDCAQLMTFLPTQPTQILDVGSGAGLPGLVLAILCPQHHFTLSERDERKAAFLHTARYDLGLTNLTVVGDVQKLDGQFPLITGRAFTETANFIHMTEHLLAPGGQWLLLKGEAVSQELSDLDGLTITRTPSITAANSWVVSLSPTP